MNLPSAARRTGAPSVRLPGLHVRDLGLVLLVLFGVGLPFWRNTDPDYWWHVKTGQLILENRSVPTQDSYSYTAAGKAWVDHEWLSQTIMYVLHSTVGFAAEVIFFAALGVGAVLIAYRLMRRLSVSEPVAISLACWATILGVVFWAVRPNTFSILLTAIFFSLAYEFARRQRDHLWLLPPLMILWANLHGGYVIGLALLATLVFGEALREGRRWPRVRHVAFIAGLSFLAAGVNPYTYKLWLYPFTYFVGDNASLDLVSEWQVPEFFHSPATVPLGVSLLVLVALGASGRRLDPWRTAIAVIFAALALQSVRQQALFAIVFPPILGELLVDRWPKLANLPRRPIGGGLATLNLGIAGAVAVLSFFLVAHLGVQAHRQPRTDLASLPYPTAGATFIARTYPDARMLNAYGWGGYLIYALSPAQRVFIDGRADLYGRRLLEDYERLLTLRPGWAEIFDDYAVDLAIFPKHSTVAEALRLDRRWREVFTGPVETVFVRSGDQAQRGGTTLDAADGDP